MTIDFTWYDERLTVVQPVQGRDLVYEARFCVVEQLRAYSDVTVQALSTSFACLQLIFLQRKFFNAPFKVFAVVDRQSAAKIGGHCNGAAVHLRRFCVVAPGVLRLHSIALRCAWSEFGGRRWLFFWRHVLTGLSHSLGARRVVVACSARTKYVAYTKTGLPWVRMNFLDLTVECCSSPNNLLKHKT